MKLVRAAAVLAGVADLGFGILFLFMPNAFHPEMDPFVYARWVGLALVGSAATLFIVVADPRRYLPVLYVNIGTRGLATLLVLLYITHFTLFIAILPSHGFLVAILVAALVYDMKLAEGPDSGEKKPVVKPVVKPVAKPAGGKPAPGKRKSAEGGKGAGSKGPAR